MYIASFSNCANVVLNNTIPQVDRDYQYIGSIMYYVCILSLSLSLSCVFVCIVSAYLYVYSTCIHLHGVFVHHWQRYEFCLQSKCQCITYVVCKKIRYMMSIILFL